MEIYKIIGVALATCISVMIVKQVKPEIAVILGLTGGMIVILMTVNSLTTVIRSFNALILKTGLSTSIFMTVLKIVGIGYLTEFAANVCMDSGSSSLADKILFAGKIVILATSMPIVMSIIEIITGLLP